MTYKRKLKLKIMWFRTLGVLTHIAILTLSFFYDKFIESIISIVFFYVFSPMFDKQFHSASAYRCSAISIIVFVILNRATLRTGESLFCAMLLTFALTAGSYIVRDILDTTVLVDTYRKKLAKFEHKALENLTENELYEALPNIPYEILQIVYKYIHRPKTISATAFAMRNYISEATLFRYLKKVKTAYEDLV